MEDNTKKIYKASPQQIDELVTSNMVRIQKNVGKLTSRVLPTQKILVVMDFDECAINNHLTRMITESFEHRTVISDTAKNENNIYALAELFNAYVGLHKDEYLSRVNEKVGEVKWNPTFKPFLQNILVNPSYFPVIVSSGIKDAIEIALDTINVKKKVHVIADEVDYDDDDTIIGAHQIVDEEQKGKIVTSLKEFGSFDRVVTVGHSRGDMSLIRAGTPGLRFAFVGDQFAMSAADHTVGTWTEIIGYLFTDL